MKLSREIARLSRSRSVQPGGELEEDPGSPEFAAITRERVDQVSRSLDRIEARQTAMFVGLLAGLIAELYRIAVHP